MVVKKSGKKAQEENNGDHAAMCGTLEDYFNSKKAYQTDQMRELNKEVTKHLLTGSGVDNAMLMEKNGDTSASSARAEADGAREDKTAERTGSGARVDDEKSQAREANGEGGDSESGSAHDYEDDYESDSSSSAAAEKSVAGRTLGDYLQANDDGSLPAESKESESDVQTTVAAPKPEKLPQKPSASSKKALPPAVVSGMSLDYYLGVSTSSTDATTDNDREFSYHADSKSPPKDKKQRHQAHKAKPKPLLATFASRQQPPPDHSIHDEFATPYQKRVKKQLKLKQRQQQHLSQGGGVAKSILLGDGHSSSQLLMAKHLPTSSSSCSSATTQVKAKRKHSTGSKNPLPKLGSSPSTLSCAPGHHHRDAHSDDDDGNGGGGDGGEEKLPPL